VYVRLAEDVAVEDVADTVLFIDHGDWYQAFREITGVSEDQVPDFVRLAYEARQDVFIDPRPGRVVVRAREGVAPRLAANIRLSWRGDLNSADSYAFEDLESTPSVLIHSDRVVSFRLLDFGDRLVFDEVDGSRVRPLDGALGTLFSVIGLASVKQVRMAVATDGTALARATVKKAFMKVSATVTVEPDGTADRGVPDGRADLEVLEAELRQDLELEYVPTEWVEVVAVAYETAAASLRLTAAERQ